MRIGDGVALLYSSLAALREKWGQSCIRVFERVRCRPAPPSSSCANPQASPTTVATSRSVRPILAADLSQSALRVRLAERSQDLLEWAGRRLLGALIAQVNPEPTFRWAVEVVRACGDERTDDVRATRLAGPERQPAFRPRLRFSGPPQARRMLGARARTVIRHAVLASGRPAPRADR